MIVWNFVQRDKRVAFLPTEATAADSMANRADDALLMAIINDPKPRHVLQRLCQDSGPTGKPIQSATQATPIFRHRQGRQELFIAFYVLKHFTLCFLVQINSRVTLIGLLGNPICHIRNIIMGSTIQFTMQLQL